MKHIFCSNCGVEIPPEQIGNAPHRAYDVCPECQESFQRQLKGQELEKFWKTIEFPAFLVNKELRVLSANESCLRSLCSGDHRPPGLMCGEFLRCANAENPEHCGGSPSCLLCSLRRAAETTFKTGKDQRNIPVSLKRAEGGQVMRMELAISTESLGDLVQITVERFFAVLEPHFRLP
jgi:hypothetical protein